MTALVAAGVAKTCGDGAGAGGNLTECVGSLKAY